MKKIISLFIVLFFASCNNGVNEVESLKYSEEDLQPLDTSDQIEYYKDASLIEFWQLVKDSTKKLNQVELDHNSILNYYSDLVSIYNYSYKISNSFFEYATSIHSHGSLILYAITVSVDTNKEWISNWNNGVKETGNEEIDKIMFEYDLVVKSIIKAGEKNFYEIISEIPINYFALMGKFKKTKQFIDIEPTVLVGTGSNISLKIENNSKYYRYYYGWGDCPSGCIHSHYWIVKYVGNKVTLIEEGGDKLK